MAQTATVVVEKVTIHPVYKKRVKTEKKYQVHDETGTEAGQRVKFAASKPYSKTKKWKIISIIKAVNDTLSGVSQKSKTKNK